jgi:hypothetical protein
MPPTLEKYTHYGLKIYSFGNGRSYAVGTEKQVDAAVREYVRDSLWAFRPEYLEAYTPEGIDAEIIGIIVEKKNEDATEIIARLVGDKLGELIDDAIAADGRGHFLSSYDGNEIDSDEIEGLPKGKIAFRI